MTTTCHYCGDRTEGNNSGMCDSCDTRMNGRITGRPSEKQVKITDLGDGETLVCTWASFLENNSETLSAEDKALLLAGECVELGGGAGEWIQVKML